MKRKTNLLLMIMFLLTGSVFAAEGEPADNQQVFTLKSPEFKEGEMMPRHCRHYSGDRSPALQWSNAPAGTVSFSITCIDYDPPANGYIHWDIRNIPSNYSELPAGVPNEKKWRDGITQERPWIGPYPPNGVHHYHFVIEAKDATGKALAKAKLVGLSD